METKVPTKKRPVKKSVEPFAEVVEAVPAAAKPPAKLILKSETKQAKPAAKRAAKGKSVTVDPFADVVVAASEPAKKPAKARTVKAKAGSAKSKPGKPVEAPNSVPVIAVAELKGEVSPEFKALAEVLLPELKRENRARLQMQTPTRLYLYWSIRDNPWAMLGKAFGGEVGSYTLVVKLADAKRGTEEIHRAEAESTFWFEVEPDGEYRAEIGFYAVNRPYFRILHSNTVTTPRRSPSPQPASEARWTVSANKFAEVLDVAGFSRDAFDVALAGDDPVASSSVTHTAFTSLIGSTPDNLNAISAEDIRYAMLALAGGAVMEDLRERISPALFAILQTNAAGTNAPRAKAALKEHFDIDETDFEQEEFGPAVFGASLVNFPKTLKTKSMSPKYAPRYNPVSSHSLR